MLPVHTSASGRTDPVAVAASPPTATQWLAEVHDTESSALNVAGLDVLTASARAGAAWVARGR